MSYSLVQKKTTIKNVGMCMIDNQSTPAHRPPFGLGCWTDTQMVDAKLHKLLNRHELYYIDSHVLKLE